MLSRSLQYYIHFAIARMKFNRSNRSFATKSWPIILKYCACIWALCWRYGYIYEYWSHRTGGNSETLHSNPRPHDAQNGSVFATVKRADTCWYVLSVRIGTFEGNSLCIGLLDPRIYIRVEVSRANQRQCCSVGCIHGTVPAFQFQCTEHDVGYPTIDADPTQNWKKLYFLHATGDN